MAGKTAKCPKCNSTISIPSVPQSTALESKRNPGGNATTKPSTVPPGKASSAGKPSSATKAAASSKPAAVAFPSTSKAASPKAATGALDQLFADAGLDKQPARICPSCKAELSPDATLCVSCGLNLGTGEQLSGFKVAGEVEDIPKFNDYRLNRAAKSLQKEQADELELRFVGAPWWVSLAVVLGLITITVFGVIYVEGMDSNAEGAKSMKAPSTSFEGRVQRQSPGRLIVIVCFLVSSMVVVMATIAVQVKAFQKKMQTGFLTLIPGYAQYYSIVARKHLRSTTKILWIWTVLWIIFAVMFFAARGYRIFTG